MLYLRVRTVLEHEGYRIHASMYLEEEAVRNAPRLRMEKLASLLTPAATEQKISDCPICKEPFEDGEVQVKTPCNHIFGEESIKKWFEGSETCPYCRNVILPVVDMDAVQEALFVTELARTEAAIPRGTPPWLQMLLGCDASEFLRT
jgi:hypothetical protein